MVENAEGAVVVLSIHPIYVDAIRTGKKKIEFRKTRFTKNVKFILIYETSPAQKIVGYFSVKSIVADTPRNLWKKFSEFGCITKSDFHEYYKSNKIGYGIEIDKYQELTTSLSINDFSKVPPQSFCYIDHKLFLTITQLNPLVEL